MNVLMIATWYGFKNGENPTAGIFHYEQAMALKPYCNTALYFPYDKSLSEPFVKGEEKGLLTYRSRDYRFPKLGKLQRLFHIFRDLKRICREFQPDILHVHCACFTGVFVTLFGKLYGYPVVITEHSPIEHFPLNSRICKKEIHYAYHNSCANVCVSPDSMERLKEQFPDCNYQVIYNGIYDPNSFTQDGREYGIPGKINCCIVASFYNRDVKGYQYLLPAVAQLKKMGKPIVLHICGGGAFQGEYETMAKELDIQDCCIFYGDCPKKQVYSILSQMDFAVSASLYESAGVSVEEALLLGRPMLVTRSGGANSLVNDRVALVVEKGSTQALAEGMVSMIEKLPQFSPGEISQYAFENFEIDHISCQYRKLYEDILTQRR